MLHRASLLTALLALSATAAHPGALAAQDSLRLPEGVRVGIEYRPGMRPSVVVLPGPGLDSVRSILARDLDYSDRFEMLVIGAGEAGSGSGPAINYALFRSLGASYLVELAADGPAVAVRLHDVVGGVLRQGQRFVLPPPFDAGFRMGVHRVADEVTRWITGTPGAAASRLLFLVERRLYRVDSDGEELQSLSAAGENVLSPAWSPEGNRVVYTRFGEGRGPLVIQDLASGSRTPVAGTGSALNITPAFSPDGRRLVYARAGEDGTDLFTVDIAQNCCTERLTVGRYSDNLSPTFAPDGRRVAFVSTRAGQPQIYVMGADGTDQELLAPFDYGATGSSNAPEWSPDGATVAFHREVSGGPQIFILDVASRRARQLTSAGRNEDPTWAADGRHLAFVSDRTGRRQLWIMDMITGRVRQLTSVGQVRLPAWSRRLPVSPTGAHLH